MSETKTIIEQIMDARLDFVKKNKFYPAVLEVGQSVARELCTETGQFSIPIGSKLYGMTLIVRGEEGIKLS